MSSISAPVIHTSSPDEATAIIRRDFRVELPSSRRAAIYESGSNCLGVVYTSRADLRGLEQQREVTSAGRADSSRRRDCAVDSVIALRRGALLDDGNGDH